MLNTILLQLVPEPTESPNLSDADASLSSMEASAALEQALMSVSGGDSYAAGDTSAVVVDQSYIDALLASSQRQEEQLEGVLSCLLIILLVGLLNYIYKFFKMFF